MSDDIRRWLEGLGLGRYADVFARNEITFDALAHLTDADLKELGLPIGPRRIVTAAIARLASPGSAAAAAPEPAASRAGAERRQLTILFCDLVGSTELSARLDPEDLRQVLRDYQDVCKRVIAAFDGYIAQFLGDGILAYFGYPRAHEDDAERAINAGLGLVSAIGQLPAHDKVAFAIRVGIATGPVVVGDLIGEGAAEQAAVTGETPNLAARLQSLAKPNTLVIGEATHRLAGGMFECTDLGRHALKGFAAPVRAWSVERPRQVESRFDATRSAAITQLVGRDEELDILLRRWQRARAGEGQTVMITGEPGIGKSRLAYALQEKIRDDPHTRMRFQCSPYHVNSALHPLIEHLQHAAQFSPDDDAAAKLNKLERLLVLAGRNDERTAALCAGLLSIPARGRYAPLALSPLQQKQHTFNAFVDQLVGLAERNPVLFLFEDAHWIDPTTLELLESIILRMRDLPVLAVITHRPEFSPSWTGGEQVTSLTLGRLSRRDRTAMAEQIARGRALPADLIEEIAGRTDGVPLFIEELTRSMLESGHAGNGGARGRRAAPAIPATLQDALTARLDRLAGGKDILQAGACIGREFSFELLAEVTQLPPEKLAAALDRLAAAQLIFRRGDPPAATYMFKHALVQDAAYGSLLRSRRAEIHGQIAQAIEKAFAGSSAAQPEIIAHHLTEANLHDRAIPMWEQAGRTAAQKFANTEAISHFSKAIDLVAALEDEKARMQGELSLQINLAPVLMAAKGFNAPEVGNAYGRARDLAKTLEDSSALFTSLWGLWLFNQMRPKKGTARSLSEELIALGRHNANSGQILQAGHASWTTNFFLGEFAYTLERAEQGMTLYDAIQHRSHKFLYGGHDPGVCSRLFAAMAALSLGYPDRALRTIENGVELAAAINHPLSRVLIELWAALVYLLRGDANNARRLIDHAIRHAAETGIPHSMWADFYMGWAISAAGDPQAGLERMLRDFGSPGAVAQEIQRPYYLGIVADTCRIVGRIDDGLGHVERGLELVETQDCQWCAAELHRIRGELLRAHGDLHGAQKCFDTSARIAHDQGALFWELRAAISNARLNQANGNPADAHSRLAGVYGAFSEGFAAADLVAARTLLDELSRHS